MQALSHDAGDVLRQLDADVQILVLVQGTLTDGAAHYAYVSIPPSRYEAFKAAEAAGSYNLAVFGEILAHGEGAAPPAEVQQRMAEEYGANHRFEEELDEWTREFNQQFNGAA